MLSAYPTKSVLCIQSADSGLSEGKIRMSQCEYVNTVMEIQVWGSLLCFSISSLVDTGVSRFHGIEYKKG